MRTPRHATSAPQSTSDSPSRGSASSGTVPDQDLHSFQVAPSLGGISTQPHTGHRDQPRVTTVRAVQVRMLMTVLSYSLIIFILLAVPVFGPMMLALDDSTLSWQEKAVVATDLLKLHDAYWPWASGAGILLVLLCVHLLRITRQMAVPLDEFRQAFRQLADGYLPVGTTRSQSGLLGPEAELMNRTAAQFQARIGAIKMTQANLLQRTDQLKQQIAQVDNLALAALVGQIEQDLADLKTALDQFRAHKG